MAEVMRPATWVLDLADQHQAIEVSRDEAGRITLGIITSTGHWARAGLTSRQASSLSLMINDAASGRQPSGWQREHDDPVPAITGPGVIRCSEPGCPGSEAGGLPPQQHTCELGKGLHPLS